MTKIYKHIISNDHFDINALSFIPNKGSIKPQIGIFTHGYTASKSSILNWANRLSDSDMACIIFDLPGHYLGSYNEVTAFSDFTEHAHFLFEECFKILRKGILNHNSNYEPETVVLGGHSLGALLSLKALDLTAFKNFERLALTVGFGINYEHDTHLFDTDFYQKTIEFRNQLVSPELDKKSMFKWIKEEKINLITSGHRIHIITGQDDVVVGMDGSDNLKNILEIHKNDVSIEKPKKLPHHYPDMAAPHINGFLRKEFNW